MASNISVVTHSSTENQKDLSLRAQRKNCLVLHHIKMEVHVTITGGLQEKTSVNLGFRECGGNCWFTGHCSERRGHQHYIKKNKVEKIAGEDKKDKIETEYYFENGLRKVYPYHFSFSSFVKGRWVGRTVEDVYVKEFRGKSRESLISEIERGNVTVNGKKVPPDFKLKHGHFLEHIVHRHENPVVGGPLQIIDNTPDLVVVNKPASIPCHPCSRFRYNTITFILGIEHGLKNLRTLYRLDRLTSGVLILPKTLKKSQRWEKQLANREFYKEYVCRVEGEFPEGTLTCDEPIELLCQHIYLFKVGPNGKPSTTTFTRLGYNGKSSVVKCIPLTGRSHQIRVHLQYLGYPILNDPIYNRAIYGKNKGKGGELECTVEEIADDIRNGTNVGRWKGDKNPKYAQFLAQKQNTNIEDNANGADIQECSDSIQSSDIKDSDLNKDEIMTSSNEIPCKRAKTDLDSSICNSDKQQLRNETNKCELNDLKGGQINNPSSDTSLQTSESVTIIPYEDRRFDESKMTYEENCEECMYLYRDPSPADLVLYLHAVRYKGPDWDYSAPLPDWADPDWTQEGTEM